jgi:hypothetical protein
MMAVVITVKNAAYGASPNGSWLDEKEIEKFTVSHVKEFIQQ